MTITNSMLNFLSSKNVTYTTKGIMGAVVGTTILKAVGRPAFIVTDKKTDKDSKKYAATKEFLYQLLCLGLTFAMVIPTQWLIFKGSKNFMKGIKELEKLKTYGNFKTVNNDINEFTPEAKKLLGGTMTKLEGKAREAFNLVKGADELGSFIASIVGLTIVAPLISHEILHPIMKAFGFGKQHKEIGKPNEVFLADAKVPTQGNNVNVKG